MPIDRLEIEIAVERALNEVQRRVRQTHRAFEWKPDLRSMLLEEIAHELFLAGLGTEKESDV